MNKSDFFFKSWICICSSTMQEIYQCMVSLREFSHGRLMAEGQKLKQYYLLLAFNIMIAFNIKALNSNSINMLHLKSANGQLSISQTWPWLQVSSLTSWQNLVVLAGQIASLGLIFLHKV